MKHSEPEGEFLPEAEPPAAAEIFGENVDKARGYFGALVRDGDLLGLLGPREMPRLWSRHILNSAVVAELLPPGATVADIGSGAGLPGIPMAIARPDCQFTLIEPMERRSDWLIKTVAQLGISNVKVMRARAEEIGEVFDVSTARAVSALPKLLKLTVPLTKAGGLVLALKGSKAAEEIEESRKLQKKLGVKGFQIVQVGNKFLAEPTSVVITELV